jgi:hypothetical protein
VGRLGDVFDEAFRWGSSLDLDEVIDLADHGNLDARTRND